ncbi:MAG: hydroxymethylglutaryl-CoA lyase [Kordiimonadaceae bacterium]|nr:hydroxymethylglutaryl-CoA lyase [Kordiimonadaceae bacterium]MBT6037536.1 hydroxymethylglutaryl-CoA lyase [Kordiimonadaceae bacterium]MBT6329204.1 hydroxymethylglutaryl-CoA lyase [Kordiimonadaceae bacterium]MBT7583272.1 hydroxymethylglutaryl-CoA lyase [Kordiimonadaceae bacterium]
MTDVIIYEVGPRDGLQNEANFVETETKIELINRLSKTGLIKIEATSFVSPKWVPQLADSSQVMAGIERKEGVSYSALTPNLKGAELAIKANVDEIAIFAAASESFSQKNINCSIEESIDRFKPVMEMAKDHKLKVRGYVSCVTHCPYDGEISPATVSDISETLIKMGCYEISLGDTIGKADPAAIKKLLRAHEAVLPLQNLALHCHDTYGRALDNIAAGLEMGIRTFDSSVAGLGGCPYAEGASGNVATEDVLSLVNSLGLNSGVDIDKIIDVALYISKKLGRAPNSKTAVK